VRKFCASCVLISSIKLKSRKAEKSQETGFSSATNVSLAKMLTNRTILTYQHKHHQTPTTTKILKKSPKLPTSRSRSTATTTVDTSRFTNQPQRTTRHDNARENHKTVRRYQTRIQHIPTNDTTRDKRPESEREKDDKVRRRTKKSS
jgi:hypothetical protein